MASGTKALPLSAETGGLKPVPPSPPEGEFPELAVRSVALWIAALAFAVLGFGGTGFGPSARVSFLGALAPEAPAVIGPKRSESSTAIGRAPIVKMSRRIPPTPVAAP